MRRRPPRSTLSSSSAASDVYKRQVPDMFCGQSDVKMHRGWQLGYSASREAVIAAAKIEVGKLKALGKKHKVVIQGYSLGAGVGIMAAWDFTCNKWLGDTPIYLITIGTPIAFYGRSSVEAYQRMVPVTNRLRIQNCGLDKSILGLNLPFHTCDGVTINLGGADRSVGYIQPWDGEFQVSWTGNTIGTTDPLTAPTGTCWGMVGTGPESAPYSLGLPPFLHCHYLDRYTQGIQRIKPSVCPQTYF
eukprot:TRINITY_DN15912_c0_g1_i1.p1 TRINITY_DN15912_c0_g1~~TRINITY_DN15912_c0_g1_i1.p1  ORF type:complete len:245 (+),score=14.69 TRINITY_DN15912_c0_g1_i1:113-847(+)